MTKQKDSPTKGLSLVNFIFLKPTPCGKSWQDYVVHVGNCVGLKGNFVILFLFMFDIGRRQSSTP